MNRLKRTCYAIVVVCPPLLAGACADGVQRISDPSNASELAAGTWRSTVWTPTDSGLSLLGTQIGSLRQLDRNLVANNGRAVELDAKEVADLKTSIEAQSAIEWIMGGASLANNSDPLPGRARPIRKLSIRGGRTLELGMAQGHRVSVQMSAEPTLDKRPPSSALFLIDGRVVSMRRYRYRRQASRWSVGEVTTSAFDSTGRIVSVMRTEINDAVSSTAGALRHLKDGLLLVGRGLGTLVLPDVLRAATVTDDDAGPCTNKQLVFASTVLAEGVAAGALAAAVAACVTTIFSCPLYWVAQAAWVGADLAFVAAWNELQECLHPPPKVIATGGGGGESGYSCWTIDWWISYDDGVTWGWLDSEEQCGWAT